MTAPLVQAGEVSRWRKLEPNYIAALLAEPRIDDARRRAAGAGRERASTSLLQALLRHATAARVGRRGRAIAARAPDADGLPCCAIRS